MERRLVYTSLDSKRCKNNMTEMKIKNQFKKKNEDVAATNTHVIEAAKVYLRNLKMIPKQQITLLYKTMKHQQVNKSSFLSKKLGEQIQRRQVQIQCLKRNIKDKAQKSQPKRKYRKKRKTNDKWQEQSIKNRYGIDPTNIIKSYRNLATDRARIRLDQFKQQQKITNNRYNQQQSEQLENRNDKQSIKKQLFMNKKNKKIHELMKRPIESVLEDRLENDQKIRIPHTTRSYLSKSNQRHKFESDHSNLSVQSLKSVEMKQKMTSTRNIKGFVINEKDELVSKYLLKQGWKQFGSQSERYTLKWTYNDNFKDYQLLRIASKNDKKMYFNHIHNNKLVSKYDFNNLAQNLIQRGVKVSEFIPQTFLVGTDNNEFIKNYQTRSIISAVSKHSQYFKSKQVNKRLGTQENRKIQIINQQIQDFVIFLLGFQNYPNSQLIINSVQQQNIVANIPLLYNILVLACNIWICQEGADSDQFDSKFYQLCSDRNIISNIITFNKINKNFQQYHRSKSSKINQSSTKQKLFQINLLNGYLRTTNSFLTPSNKLIQAIYNFQEYFMSRQVLNYRGGNRNLWIIKPSIGSKGFGIQIVERYDKILQILESGSNKIVQKYIQDVWTFKSQMVHQIQFPHSYQHFVNKKFDIRQWVLLVPPQSYIFSSFYLRICAKQYHLRAFSDQTMHLSNFTVNKQHFVSPQLSVMSQEAFKNLLFCLKKQKQYEKLKNKIRQRVKYLCDEAVSQCQIIPGTFQILGFDILLDQTLNPWIIQCNMSPACDTRTQWLKQMKQSMTLQSLKIVLDQQIFNDSQKESKPKFNWVQLSKGQVQSEKQITKGYLEINGVKLKLNKKNERNLMGKNYFQQAQNQNQF